MKMACSSTEFWDRNVSWNTDIPDFTDCFKSVVCVYIPTAFIAILAMYEVLKSVRQKDRQPHPVSLLFGSKVFLCVFLVFLSLTELWLEFQNQDLSLSVADGMFITSTCKAATNIAVLFILIMHRSKGLRFSNMLCVFWFLQSIAGVIMHRSSFLKVYYKQSPMESYELFVIDMLYYPIIYCQATFSLFSEKDPSKKLSALEGETFFLYLTFCWLDKLIFKSRQVLLDFSDLTPLPSYLKTSYAWMKFRSKWMKNRTSTGEQFCHTEDKDSKQKLCTTDNLSLCLTRSFSKWVIYYMVSEIINDFMQFLPSLFLDYLLRNLNDKYQWKSFLICGALVLSTALSRFTQNLFMLYSGLCAMQVKSALMITIYRKVLKMSCSSRRNYTLGELTNLMAVDVDKIFKFVQYASMLLGCPLRITISIIFLWHYLGPSCMAGIAVVVILVPLSLAIGKKLSSIQERQMKAKDNRLKHIAEVISGIKVLKLYAWEIPFIKKISSIRDKEVRYIRKQLFYFSIASFIWGCAPFLISIASFITFIFVDENNVLTASSLFVSLNIMTMLRYSLFMISDITSNLAQTHISLKRLKALFLSEEREDDCVGAETDNGQAISVKHAVLAWDKTSPPTLSDINLQIPNGSLVAVIGAVGSGKSSLISALLGDMHKISGSLNMKGSVAYVPQQAWILNQTLRENILFNETFSSDKYRNTLKACSLDPDLKELAAGDMTEIGEKGVNLSGGQKQRVSLARAVYQNADIYFLDDPLSAVDAHVGKHIFENVIGNAGLLKDKTRILVTHNTSVLPFVDVIFTLKNGKIEESGTFHDLINKSGPFSEFIKDHKGKVHSNNDKNDEKDDIGDIIEDEGMALELSLNPEQPKKFGSTLSLQAQKFSKLTEDEKIEAGEVKWRMYANYSKHAGIHVLVPCVLFYFLYQAFEIWTKVALSEWSEDRAGDLPMTSRYNEIVTVLVLGLCQALFVVTGNVLLAVSVARASKKYHQELFYKLMRYPLSFYDTTPQGRIMNRCSKDIDVMDCDVPFALDGFLACFFQVIGTFMLIGMVTGYFYIFLIPVGVLYYFAQKLFLVSSRQLKRLESVSRSPVYSYFQESVQGTSSIRAYEVEDDFIKNFEKKVDTTMSCSYHWFMSTRWIAVRLDVISVTVVFIAAILAVHNRHELGASYVGLSLIYAMSILNVFTWMVRTGVELENNAISIERIDEYSNLTAEAEWLTPENQPPEVWPENGMIAFENYSTAYRQGLDLVLKKLNLNIDAKEKIGIVGRTGAGKSSLTLSLFRIIEPRDGVIKIDDVDISQIGLHTLRSKLAIIPQEPVLFTGSLRSNLDPNEEYTDDAIWTSLERAHLKEFFVSLAKGLEFEIAEGGENLSVGQRQLICLARSLLKKSRILIMDEATAAVDVETDKLIQNAIRSEFQNCTVLIIAHRLNTILDCDKIIVMDSGQIAEMGKPKDLLENKDSMFAMMQEAALL